LAREGDRRLAEVDAGHVRRAEARPGERIEPEVALHVEKPLAGDVADLRALPRLDAHVRRIVAEALDVVERAGRVDGGPGIPELPVFGDLARELLDHARP